MLKYRIFPEFEINKYFESNRFYKNILIKFVMYSNNINIYITISS